MTATNLIHDPIIGSVLLNYHDITGRKQAEDERESTIQMLEIINAKTDLRELMSSLLGFMKKLSGCEALGIRLRDGDDFPYYTTRGFDDDFVEAETHLCVESIEGQLEQDELGNPVLECMCGNIICGRFDPSMPFFTDHGSFISNHTTELLASTTEEDRQARTRNRFNAEGYESVFLVPLRAGGETFGLLQFNDRRKEYFSPEFIDQVERMSGNVAIALAQRKAEQALKESEQTYRELLSNLNSGVVVHAPDTSILVANPAASKILGLSEDQMSGIKAMDPQWKFLRDDGSDMPLDEYPVNQVLSTNKPLRNLVVGVNRPQTGDVAWALVNGFPVHDGSGQLEQMVINFVDITERKKAEEEKEKLEGQLRQAQKMEAVGRLAGGVAHDFNNILTGINGYAEMLLEGLEPGDPMRADMEEIKSAGERAAGLTNQLLAFSRKQVIAPKVVQPNEILENSQKMLRRIIGEDIDLVFVPEKKLGRIKADPAQLDQILVNLAVNARDAMTDVGKLTIETQNITLDQEFCDSHVGAEPGDYVMLAVTDTGHGMDDETRSNIFVPFFSTKDKGKGTGLGLATVYGIVKQNNGFITVYSEPGTGTTFKVYFPRVMEKADKLSKEKASDLPTGTETVLLVEDEAMVRGLAKKILERQGYKVIAMENGGVAYAHYDEHDDPFDLLLTDVVMPSMNGRTLFNKLREKRPELKAVFMSGYTENVIAHHGVLDEGVHFIQKPFTIETLAKMVRKVLDS